MLFDIVKAEKYIIKISAFMTNEEENFTLRSCLTTKKIFIDIKKCC